MPTINYNSPASRQGTQLAYGLGNDYRQQALTSIRRGQDLTILNAQGRKDALNMLLQNIVQRKQSHEAAQDQREAAKPNFWRGVADSGFLPAGLDALLGPSQGGGLVGNLMNSAMTASGQATPAGPPMLTPRQRMGGGGGFGGGGTGVGQSQPPLMFNQAPSGFGFQI